jgi:hypothetical protein
MRHWQSVEKLPIAASPQKVQTLTYHKYASTFNFFCSLHLGFLNGLPTKTFSTLSYGPDRRVVVATRTVRRARLMPKDRHQPHETPYQFSL